MEPQGESLPTVPSEGGTPRTIDVVTLFPGMFTGFLEGSLLGKGRERGLLEVNLVNLRPYGQGKHQQVDDIPYGGGAGMVLKPEPMIAAVEDRLQSDSYVIAFSPQGPRLTQSHLVALSLRPHLILLCGRYEGFDERIVDLVVDEELSIGDYVLSGGEVAAMVLIDALSRLVPGVVKEFASVQEDSFFEGLLDYPHYTRPRDFRGLTVPEPLLSGDHARIERWRREQQLLRSARRRPDLVLRLLAEDALPPEDIAFLRRHDALPNEPSPGPPGETP